MRLSYDSDQRTQRKSIRVRDQAHVDCRRNPLRYFHRQEETCQTSAEAAGAQKLRQRVVRMEHRSSVARTSEVMHILDPTRQLEFRKGFAPSGPDPKLHIQSIGSRQQRYIHFDILALTLSSPRGRFHPWGVYWLLVCLLITRYVLHVSFSAFAFSHEFQPGRPDKVRLVWNGLCRLLSLFCSTCLRWSHYSSRFSVAWLCSCPSSDSKSSFELL